MPDPDFQMIPYPKDMRWDDKAIVSQTATLFSALIDNYGEGHIVLSYVTNKGRLKYAKHN